MVKNTYILGNNMQRKNFVQISVVDKILDKYLFDEICQYEPFAAKLLLDTFKEFLTNTYFEKIERQTVLLQFFKNNYSLEIYREIISFLNNCDFKDDYIKIIMEWNLIASEVIRRDNLKGLDGEGFIMEDSPAKYNNNNKEYPLSFTLEFWKGVEKDETD